MTSSHHNILSLRDVNAAGIDYIINWAIELKKQPLAVQLAHKPAIAIIFEKPSTRTRVSFDVAIRQFGGESVVLNQSDLQLSRGESLADTARVLSRYVNCIVIRANQHTTVEQLAKYASVPVINALTDQEHPCQILADLMTVKEHLGSYYHKKITWLGDYNNVCASWLAATEVLGLDFHVAIAPQLCPDDITNNTIADAVRDADVIITDTWFSMGHNGDKDKRRKLLQNYRITPALMAQAKANAIFMHCLPADRDDEVSPEVIDGKQSVVFDEAENRLHSQKALLLWCLGVAKPQ